MTTTVIDAPNGVVHGDVVDHQLVAIRTWNPRAAWTRTKVRTLEALRRIRQQAAARQAAIAQFVKPYWERIPSGLLGFSILAALSNTGAYRWVMRKVNAVGSITGRAIKTTLTWGGRATRWLAHRGADVVGMLAPKTGARMHAWIDRFSAGTAFNFELLCSKISEVRETAYITATHPAAVATISKLAFPLAVGVAANMVTQGLIASIVSAVPVVGLPLAAALSTTKGMVAAGGAITALGYYDGFMALRDDKAALASYEAPVVPVAPVAPAPAPAAPSPKVEVTETEIETREVMVEGETVVLQVVGASKLSEAEAEELAIKYLEEKQHQLEEELVTPQARRSGPAGKRPRGKQQAAAGR